MIRCPEEAAAYVKALQTLLRAVGSSDANMEQVYSVRVRYIAPHDLIRVKGFFPL